MTPGLLSCATPLIPKAKSFRIISKSNAEVFQTTCQTRP